MDKSKMPNTLTPEQLKTKNIESMRYTRVRVGAEKIKASMKEPDSFKVVLAMVIDGSDYNCYGYTAKNGFGGLSDGKATFNSKTGVVMDSDLSDEFNQHWNKYCAGSKYYDYTRQIQASRI